MAELITCTVCGREISSEAKFCPGCGQPDPKPKYSMEQYGGMHVGKIELLTDLESSALVEIAPGVKELVSLPVAMRNKGKFSVGDSLKVEVQGIELGSKLIMVVSDQ